MKTSPIEQRRQTGLIKEIGRRGFCMDIELLTFLPEFPTPRGSEYIFTISHANANGFIDNEVEDFVKGLHNIELAYRRKTENNFGFGSPSPTAKVILAIDDASLNSRLRKWVAENGGNYYIQAEEVNT